MRNEIIKPISAFMFCISTCLSAAAVKVRWDCVLLYAALYFMFPESTIQISGYLQMSQQKRPYTVTSLQNGAGLTESKSQHGIGWKRSLPTSLLEQDHINHTGTHPSGLKMYHRSKVKFTRESRYRLDVDTMFETWAVTTGQQSQTCTCFLLSWESRSCWAITPHFCIHQIRCCKPVERVGLYLIEELLININLYLLSKFQSYNLKKSGLIFMYGRHKLTIHQQGKVVVKSCYLIPF